MNLFRIQIAGPVTLAFLWFLIASWTLAAAPLEPGGGTLDWEWNGKNIPVHYFLPEGTGPDRPVAIVLHGMSRNAKGALRTWKPLAEQYGALVVVPEFTTDTFPGNRSYNMGNLADGDGGTSAPETWTFSALEPLFDCMREATGTETENYFLYGHSAGGQFAHRFLFLIPDHRATRSVIANPGWYTLPDASEPWPGGLAGTGMTDETLRAAFARPAIVLLGEEDNDPNHKQLSQSRIASAQGPHRVARGRHFFARSKTAAADLGTPFAWEIAVVPGVGHSNRGMSAAAAEWLFESKE